MSVKSPHERIIFGLKVKQLRQAQGKSFAVFSEETGMSVSYLNEIEKGKKYPKADKIENLAAALDISVEELGNGSLGRHLEPVENLLRSNFLNDLPLELFGIELSKVAEIIASAPARVGAFISTLLELSRTYSVHEENFYFGALRSYLELHDNYFQEIEDVVDDFCNGNKLSHERPIPPRILAELLRSRYGYTVVEDGLDQHPALQSLRSVYLPDDKRLLLNGRLQARQKAFQLGKELGFNALKIQERAQTGSLLRVRNFEEVLNHSKATYFSVALLLPLQPFLRDVRDFFELEQWEPDKFVGLMHRYNASPEMLYHRLTNVLPRFFSIPELFFLRFLHDPVREEFSIDKELHLNHQHHPHGNALREHYCRRWVSLSLLQELSADTAQDAPAQLVSVQRSRYLGTDDEYLCITIARPAYPSPEKNVSLTLGLLINEDIKREVKWLDDPSIPQREVHTTCERCPLTDCAERAAPPLVVQRKERHRQIREALKDLR